MHMLQHSKFLPGSIQGNNIVLHYIHYGFQQEEHPIIYAPHSKSKGSTPYKLNQAPFRD